MITMVTIIGWMLAGIVTTIASVLTRHVFKKYTKLEARVSNLEPNQEAQKSTEL